MGSRGSRSRTLETPRKARWPLATDLRLPASVRSSISPVPLFPLFVSGAERPPLLLFLPPPHSRGTAPISQQADMTNQRGRLGPLLHSFLPLPSFRHSLPSIPSPLSPRLPPNTTEVRTPTGWPRRSFGNKQCSSALFMWMWTRMRRGV